MPPIRPFRTAYRLMLFAVSLTSLCAWGEEPSSPKAEVGPEELELSAQIPFTLANPTLTPVGFSDDSLLAPYSLNLAFNQAPQPDHLGGRLTVSAYFARYSTMPAMEVTPAVRFKLGHAQGDQFAVTCSYHWTMMSLAHHKTSRFHSC